MNPDLELARNLVLGATVLLGIARLALWCYALFRIRRWFLILLAFSALMNVGFGLVSLALLSHTVAWARMLGPSGYMICIHVLLYGQVIGSVIEIAGVAFLVVWLCRSHGVAAPPNNALQPTATAPSA
jgi:hypothetical protein